MRLCTAAAIVFALLSSTAWAQGPVCKGDNRIDEARRIAGFGGQTYEVAGARGFLEGGGSFAVIRRSGFGVSTIRTVDRSTVLGGLDAMSDKFHLALDEGEELVVPPRILDPAAPHEPWAPDPLVLPAEEGGRVPTPLVRIGFRETTQPWGQPPSTRQIIGDIDVAPAADLSRFPYNGALAQLQTIATTIWQSRWNELNDAIGFLVNAQRRTYCNAINIGGGRFLTNAHCFIDAAAEYRLLLGPLTWQEGPQAALDCEVREISVLRTLDAATFALKAEDIGLYYYRSVDLSDGDPWCRDAACVDGGQANYAERLATPLRQFQIWTSAPAGRLAEDGVSVRPSAGMRSMSTAACLALPSRYSNDSSLPRQDVGACDIDGDPDIGRGHVCDSEGGGSGSALFADSEIAEYLLGHRVRPRLAGLHRGGDSTRGNCAIPATIVRAALSE